MICGSSYLVSNLVIYFLGLNYLLGNIVIHLVDFCWVWAGPGVLVTLGLVRALGKFRSCRRAVLARSLLDIFKHSVLSAHYSGLGAQYSVFCIQYSVRFIRISTQY